MTGAKSALEVRDGLTFLDIIALQVLALRERWDVELPLVLMNSFRTSEESLKILAKYDSLAVDGLPLDFIQNAEPKLHAGRPPAGAVAPGSRARVVPSGARRRLRLARHLGRAGLVAGEGDSLRLPLQLRQPRCHL